MGEIDGHVGRCGAYELRIELPVNVWCPDIDFSWWWGDGINSMGGKCMRGY